MDPGKYVKEVLGIDRTWRLQDELISACPRSVKERKPIFVASGHSLGKDYICAAAGLWFLDTYVPSQVILTAPTDRQVKGIMWKETMGHWNNRLVRFAGKPFIEPKIQISESHYLIGFTTKETGATKEGGGGKFQGFHAPSVCIIVTEAQAVEDVIYDQIDAITTVQNILVIFIGNPTRARGRFAAGLRDKVHNIVFNFSCLENPNYLERREVIPGLASYDWVEAMRQKWGEDDPRWVGRVLGQIPDQAINNIFTDALFELGFVKYGFLAAYSDNRGVSVDPAGEGVDDNVFMAGSAGEVMEVFTKATMSATDKAHKAVEMCKRISGSWIIVDCDGLGIETYLQLQRLSPEFMQGIQIIKFHGCAASELTSDGRKPSEGGKRIYENLRCEAAFVTQERLRSGKAALDRKDAELIEDLREDIHFENKRSGLIQIIPKDEIKEVLGRSPGRGDAYKMLQWAFSRDFKPISQTGNYYHDRDWAPSPASQGGRRLPDYIVRD